MGKAFPTRTSGGAFFNPRCSSGSSCLPKRGFSFAVRVSCAYDSHHRLGIHRCPDVCRPCSGTPRPIIGRASVIDGDTIEIRGQRIRLFGIDAPESRQTCTDPKGVSYRCGQRAAQALDYRISDSPVTCEPKDRDRYGRIVAVCRAYGEDYRPG